MSQIITFISRAQLECQKAGIMNEDIMLEMGKEEVIAKRDTDLYTVYNYRGHLLLRDVDLEEYKMYLLATGVAYADTVYVVRKNKNIEGKFYGKN